MKKILAVCSVLLASTSLAKADHLSGHSGPAPKETAATMNMSSNYYVGGDIGYIMHDLKGTANTIAEDDLPFINIYAGYNFNKGFALEWGGFHSSEEDRRVGGVKTDTKEYGVFVDAVGKHHMDYGLTALGSVGLQYSKLKIDNATTKIDDKELIPRLGAGLEYKFHDNMRARGMVRYLFSDYNDAVDDTMQYTLGMNYSF